jgi:hypothetical protein
MSSVYDDDLFRDENPFSIETKEFSKENIRLIEQKRTCPSLST